jgi:hypothetical protein
MIRLFLIVVVLAVVGSSAYLVYTSPDSLPEPLQQFAPVIQSSVGSALGGIQSVVSKGESAQPAVMGVKTQAAKIFQPDTSDTPIHQKAMEFTQYQYCKMVIENYEKKLSETASTPSPSPKEEE